MQLYQAIVFGLTNVWVYQASVWATSQNSQQEGLPQSVGDGNGMNVEKNGFLFGPLTQSLTMHAWSC